MHKRGNISAFIALGVIIFTIVIILILSKPELNVNTKQSILEIPINNLIDTCIKQVADESLYDAALGGGYYDVPLPFYDHWYGAVPYYYDRGIVLVPLKDRLENELAKYISNKLNACISYEAIEKLGFFIVDKSIEPTASIKISKEAILFKISFPLELQKGGSIQTLGDFSYTKETHYLDLYDLANSFTRMQASMPESICMSCLSREAEEKNLSIMISAVNSENLLIEIIEDGENPLVWVFAHRYEGDQQ